jgi:ABC-type antimicrobial peptide transport system permease subunit
MWELLGVTRAELQRHPSRSAFLALAVGSALSIPLVLEGFHSGVVEQLRQTVLQRGADLIAVQAGVTNFLATRSRLPQLSRGAVEAVSGVRNADPLTLLPVIFEHEGRQAPIYLMVYDQSGGPGELLSGHLPREPTEVVVDISLAAMFGLSPGDPLTISDFSFRIAGVTANAAAFFASAVFVTYDDLIDFYFASDVMGDIATVPLLSYLLIELEEEADLSVVQSALERAVPSIDAYLPENLAENDAEMGRALLGPVIGVLISLSYLISLMVIGMILSANARARRHAYGVLMALGFRRRQLIAGLATEGLAITAAAIPIAVILASGLAPVIEAQAPLYLLPILEPVSLTRSGIAALGLALVSTGWAYGAMARLEPAVAFRG